MNSSWKNATGKVDSLYWLVLALLATWLIWAVFQVNIEFDDGYATLANAAYFLGVRPEHFFNRGPLLAIALIPVTLLNDAFAMHPLDVRFAHALMALLHLGYLVGTWKLLARVHGRDFCTLLAYVGTVATPVFFSYAPFLSLDIFPGALALWMLYLVDQQMRAPSMRRWLGLVALGAALALLKQTYALLWVGVLLSLPILLLAQRADRSQWRTLGGLFAAAALGGALTWVAYGAALATPFGGAPLLVRPWLEITAINAMYNVEGGAENVFYPWIYLQNLWAYGLLPVLLILPAIVLALARGSSFERLVAMVWLFMVVTLQLTPYKEVRYLAFLAPFSALLLVPLLRRLWQQREAYRAALLATLVAGLIPALPEALRLRHPYYREAVLGFLAPLPTDAPLAGRLIAGGPLSFVSPEASAYFGDRYHRITHLMPSVIMALYGYPADRLWQIKQTDEVRADRVSPGDVWLLTTNLLTRTKPFVPGNREGLSAGFFQLIAVAESVALERDGGGYRIVGAHAEAPYVLVGTSSDAPPFIAVGSIDEATAMRFLGSSTLPAQVQLTGFRVLRRCSLTECARYD